MTTAEMCDADRMPIGGTRDTLGDLNNHAVDPVVLQEDAPGVRWAARSRPMTAGASEQIELDGMRACCNDQNASTKGGQIRIHS